MRRLNLKKAILKLLAEIVRKITKKSVHKITSHQRHLQVELDLLKALNRELFCMFL